MLGRAQQRLIVDVADVACFEQHRRRVGAAKDVERGEAMRLRAALRNMRRISALSLPRIGFGVAAGATMPFQLVAS